MRTSIGRASGYGRDGSQTIFLNSAVASRGLIRPNYRQRATNPGPIHEKTASLAETQFAGELILQISTDNRFMESDIERIYFESRKHQGLPEDIRSQQVAEQIRAVATRARLALAVQAGTSSSPAA